MLDSTQNKIVYTGTYAEITKILGVTSETLRHAAVENRLVGQKYFIEKVKDETNGIAAIRKEWQETVTRIKQSDKDLSRIKIVGRD